MTKQNGFLGGMIFDTCETAMSYAHDVSSKFCLNAFVYEGPNRDYIVLLREWEGEGPKPYRVALYMNGDLAPA